MYVRRNWSSDNSCQAPLPPVVDSSYRKMLAEQVKHFLAFLCAFPPFIRHLIGHPIRHPSVILSEISLICILKMACLFSSFIAVNSAIFVILSDISSDISSDIPYEKPVAYAKIGLL